MQSHESLDFDKSYIWYSFPGWICMHMWWRSVWKSWDHERCWVVSCIYLL